MADGDGGGSTTESASGARAEQFSDKERRLVLVPALISRDAGLPGPLGPPCHLGTPLGLSGGANPPTSKSPVWSHMLPPNAHP